MAKTKTENERGTGVMPEKVCDDKKCPYHGKVLVKKESYTGKVIRKDASRSATVEWERQYFIPKFERYELRRSRLRVHNSPCIDAAIGDTVKVMKTRPISKTKKFVVVEVLKDESSKG